MIGESLDSPSFPLDDTALFQQASSTNTLLAAWKRVLANGGAAGGDNVTLQHFQVNLHRRVAQLSRAVRAGTYLPGPIRRIEIPKRDGSTRPLAIPCVGDRIAQTAVGQVLGPLLEWEFEDSSYGYRPGRGVRDAVHRVSQLRDQGHGFVVDADISRFFENVPHDKLLDRLAQSLTDGPLTQLISLWLEHGAPTGQGLAQGSPLSPLLANLYLDKLDEAFAKRGAHIVRFADDFLILTESRRGAEGALERAENLLSEHGLRLNREKTRVTSFDLGFRFLGHLFVRSMVVLSKTEEIFSEFERAMRALARDDASSQEEKERALADFDRKRRTGYDPGHRVMHVISPDRRLTLRNQAFAVQSGSSKSGVGATWRDLLALPHSEVDRIDLGPHADIEPEALRHALATDTLVAFVTGHGETNGWLSQSLAPRAARHLAQARHASDEELRLGLASKFVEGRIKNQRALLRRLNRRRRDPAILRTLAELNGILRRLYKAETLAGLMGFEGRATSLYWPAFSRSLDNGFGLVKRQRKGELDACNIMLNVTSSLLARDVSVAICRASLHPGFGFLHSTQDYRDSAVLDLMEEFRAPLSESVVVQAVNRRAIGHDDFERQGHGSGVRLRRRGYAALVRAYEHAAGREIKSQHDGKRRTWRGIMLDQALALVRHFEGRQPYSPYCMDY